MHTYDPQYTSTYGVGLKKENWINFFMQLITGICGNNYYNVYDHVPNKYVQLFMPFTGKVIRAYSKLNKLMDLRKKCCEHRRVEFKTQI